MSLDAAANFARGTLAAGITAGATSLAVGTGEGALFPAVPFNAVVFDSTTSNDPMNDSSREIVRVTDVAGDVLTITRAQEGASAYAHNTALRRYWISAGPTAKLVTDVNAHISATGTNVHGLGSMSAQASSSVSITGGSITGITDLAVADGGTGSSTAPTALLALGAANLAGIMSRTDNALTLSQGTGTTPNIQGTFVIAPTGTNFSFYTAGLKYTKAAADSATCTVTVPATQAQYYIYFDASGVLQISTSPWDIASDQAAPVSVVYWDPVTGTGTKQDERHSAYRNRQWHNWAHDTIGTRYGNGFVGTFANTTLSITQGTIYDEDLVFTSSASAATTCRLWYRDATKLSRMQFIDGATTPYRAVAGLLKYDNGGTLTSVTQNWYVVNWIYATNDSAHPIECVISQAQYTSSTAYNAAVEPAFTNLSTREWKLLYKVVYRNINDTTPTFVSAVDMRSATTIPSAGVATLPASAVTFVPGGSLAALDVQGALDELDTEKVPTTLTITATAPLTIAGTTSADLSAGRTIAVSVGTGAATVCAGDDSRLANSRTPVAHQLDTATFHAVSGLTTGHFLKATAATTFGFAAHGLDAAAVGALATAGTAADSDKLDGQHGSYYQTLLTNPVTGTGTTGKIPKLTGASTLGDSVITESGGTVDVAGNFAANIAMNPSFVAADFTVPSYYNAYSAGPLTIRENINVTLGDYANWSVL